MATMAITDFIKQPATFFTNIKPTISTTRQKI